MLPSPDAIRPFARKVAVILMVTGRNSGATAPK